MRSDALQWLTQENVYEKWGRRVKDSKEFLDSTFLFSYFFSRGILKFGKKLLKTNQQQISQFLQLTKNELWALLIITNLYHIGSFQKPVLEARKSSQPNKRPLLLIHGIWHNSSAFFMLKRYLRKSGWNYIFYIDLQTARFSIPELAEQLRDYVESILKETGKKRIDFIAHSLGGIISRYYIQFLGGKEKVKNLITLGTPHRGTTLSFLGLHESMRSLRPTGRFMNKLNSEKLPPNVHYTSIWSPFDFMILPPENAILSPSQAINPTTVMNIETPIVSHGGFLVSKNTFKTIMNVLQS